ncbi:hypothetical protein JCM10207_002498 [Rhodosporidiobolus poonsookiae]
MQPWPTYDPSLAPQYPPEERPTEQRLHSAAGAASYPPGTFAPLHPSQYSQTSPDAFSGAGNWATGRGETAHSTGAQSVPPPSYSFGVGHGYPPSLKGHQLHPSTKRPHPDYLARSVISASYPNPNSAHYHSPYPSQPLAQPPRERVVRTVRPPTAADFAPQVALPAQGYPYPPVHAHNAPPFAQTAHQAAQYPHQHVYSEQPSQPFLRHDLSLSPHLGFPPDEPPAPILDAHQSSYNSVTSVYDNSLARLHHPALAHSPFRHRQRTTTLASNPARSGGRAASRTASASSTASGTSSALAGQSAITSRSPPTSSSLLQFMSQTTGGGGAIEAYTGSQYGFAGETGGQVERQGAEVPVVSDYSDQASLGEYPLPPLTPFTASSAPAALQPPLDAERPIPLPTRPNLPYPSDILVQSTADGYSLPPSAAALPGSPPVSDTELLSVVNEAARRREAHASQPPPLAYKPARASTSAATSARPRSRTATAESDSRSSTPGSMAALGASPREAHERALARKLRDERCAEAAQLERGRVNRNAAGAVVSLEVAVRCSCGACPSTSGASMPLARVVLRALSSSMVGFLDGREGHVAPAAAVAVDEARGWRCLEQAGQVTVKAKEAKAVPKRELARAAPPAPRGPGALGAEESAEPVQGGKYEDTLSAAVDRLKSLDLQGSEQPTDAALGPSSAGGAATGLAVFCGQSATAQPGVHEEREDWQDLKLIPKKAVAEQWKARVLKCDVCAQACGVASLSPSPQVIASHSPSSPARAPPFTVEVVCARCDALFKCCSDCGGGGGRLTPGRWRCRELFPDGRKTCKLSHTRNPALGDVSCEVFPFFPAPPADLASLAARCKTVFFNSRLGGIARPDFLLKGDGLASTFAQVERVTIDHWALMEKKFLMDEQPAEHVGIRRYVIVLCSRPRKRHLKRGEKAKDVGAKAAASEQVPFGFAIAEADFNLGTLYFACALPWHANGQGFDAMTMLGETTTARVKADIAGANLRRFEADLPLYPPLKYNYTTTPFSKDSRGNLGLMRRGYEDIDDLVRKDPSFPVGWFPPIKEVWLPVKYAAALRTWIRVLDGEEDFGGPPTENAPRKRSKKAVERVEQDRSPSLSSLPFLSAFPTAPSASTPYLSHYPHVASVAPSASATPPATPGLYPPSPSLDGGSTAPWS